MRPHTEAWASRSDSTKGHMRYFLTDTETAKMTGPIVDVAVIEVNANLDVIGTYECLVDPQEPMSPAAQAVHGITDAMVADAPTMAELIERDGKPFPQDEEITIVAHNAQFDCRMLTQAGLLPENYTRACTLKMARTIYADIDKERCNHKLGTLAIMFGLETGPAHRAMGDTVTMLNLLRRMAADTGATSLDELLLLGTRHISQEDKLDFGKKHNTDKIKDVPKSYIDWMFKNVTDLDPDLRAALEIRMKS